MRTVEKDIHTDYVADAVFGTRHTEHYRAQLLWAHVTVTTTATAGNRTILFSVVRDSDSAVLYTISAGVNQAASTVRHYNFVPGAVREGSFSGGNEILLPLAPIIFGAGISLKITDVNAVDAADTYALGYQAEK